MARHLLLRRLDLCGDHAALVQNLVQLPRVHLQQQLRFHVLVRRTPVPRENLGREVKVNHVLLSIKQLIHRGQHALHREAGGCKLVLERDVGVGLGV